MLVRASLLLFLLLTPRLADAHPHVWVIFRSQVVYAPTGEPVSVRQSWTFDDMYSTFALQGIAHAKKGEYSRPELSGLAKLNISSLKEYDYFTYAKADGRGMPFAAPIEYWLDYNDSSLTLHFTLPFKTPVAVKSLLVEVYDPTIFVDFSFAKDNTASLQGAPKECQLKTMLPRQPTAREQKQMSELDTNPDALSHTYGEVFANKIIVTCP